MCSPKTLRQIARQTGDSPEHVLAAESDALRVLSNEPSEGIDEDVENLAAETGQNVDRSRRMCLRLNGRLAEKEPDKLRPDLELLKTPGKGARPHLSRAHNQEPT